MSFGSDGVPSLKRRTLALAIDLVLGTLMVLLMNARRFSVEVHLQA